MSDPEDAKTKPFKVVDRRHSAPGDDRDVTQPIPVADEPRAGGGALPEIDFATFLISLSTSAFIHLGEMAHPETGKPEKNLGLARQTIDTLGMLQQKTKGNLSRDEERLFEHLLSELRLKYVEANKKG